jgi:hypothetical protein
MIDVGLDASRWHSLSPADLLLASIREFILPWSKILARSSWLGVSDKRALPRSSHTYCCFSRTNNSLASPTISNNTHMPDPDDKLLDAMHDPSTQYVPVVRCPDNAIPMISFPSQNVCWPSCTSDTQHQSSRMVHSFSPILQSDLVHGRSSTSVLSG